MRVPHRYDRHGLLAIEPTAFFDLFFEPPTRENAAQGDTALVTIRGPLESHRGWWCDSYDEILGRVAAACETSAKAVVLVVDSPGGDVAGMLECANAIRARVEAAGKRLLAYVDGKACSAAYALACVAERIVIAEQALVGSVGVLSMRPDFTGAAASSGIKVAFVTSGARKADGHPQQPISEAELAAMQTIVDQLASTFFAHVARERGLEVDAIAALEARVFAGTDAVQAGLADAIGTLDSVLALASTAAGAAALQRSTTVEEAKKALQAIIDDENADEASKARAKKALAAMDEDEPGDDEKSKAEGESGDDEDKEKKDEEAKARSRSSVSASTAGELASRLSAVERQLEAQARGELLASRPDLSPSLVKLLGTKPLDEVKAIVGAIEKPKKPSLADKAATAVVGATRGEGTSTERVDRLAPEAAAQMDRAMGLTKLKPGVVQEGNRLFLGALVPEAAPAAK